MMIDRSFGPKLTASQAFAYWSSFVAEHYLRHLAFNRMRTRLEDRLASQGFPELGTIPIPRVDPASMSPEGFHNDYITGYTPVVLTGAGKNWPAVQKWSPEFFRSTYPDERIWARIKSGAIDTQSVYSRDISMTELIDNVMSGGEYYANNLEDLFNNHPELREDLLLGELQAYSRPPSKKPLPPKQKGLRFPHWGEITSTQIFISSSRGRTAYHCAAGGNFFLQVYGQKRWTFVNPRHTPFMYPAVRKDFIFSVSGIDCRLAPEDVAAAGFPLYNVIPKYEAVLEPGDVLYSPQWWWHTVDNLGRSIGVAMRFRTATFASNPAYSTLTVLSPALWRVMLQLVRTGWGADAAAARRFFEPEGTPIDDRTRQVAVASKARAASQNQ